MRHIGVAISGGGNRSALWGLGVLLYLVDAGKNAETGAVSSVSGGSITNGYVAQEVEFTDVDTGRFDDAVKPLAHDMAFRGTRPWSPVSTWYVVGDVGAAIVAILAMVAAVVLAFAHAGLSVTLPLLFGGLVVLVVALQVFEQRSRMVEIGLARQYFTRDGKRTGLAQVARSVDHVICATELQSALHLYFSPRFVYTYELGVGDPGQMSLATAVQCSACLPVAFAARRLSAAKFGFTGGALPPNTKGAGHVVLSDGGVYDNMADEWFDGFNGRAGLLGSKVVNHDIDEVIVANASSPPPWQPLRRVVIALVAEFATLSRVTSVMYAVTTKTRRRSLVEEWDDAALMGKGTQGALVHIAQSPYRVADELQHDERFPDRVVRAKAVIAQLGDNDTARRAWDDITRRSLAVPTVLRALGRSTTLELLQHAYVLAMCNLHVVLGYPLLPLPDRERFERLLG